MGSRRQRWLISQFLAVGLALTNVAGAADPNLIGWWSFDEGSGTTAHDASGRGHDSQFKGNPVWVAGHRGSALEFDGVDDYVLCAERTGTGPGVYPAELMPQTFTVSCWLRLNQFAYFSSFVGNGMDTGDNECGFFLYNWGWIGDNEKDFGLAIRTETAMSYVETPNIYETGTWYHLAATYDGMNANIYVDGSLVAGPTNVGGPMRWVSATTGNYPERFAIGVWLDPGYDLWINGTIDDVRYYNRCLSEDEVKATLEGGAELAGRPTPKDAATDVPRDAVLGWTAGKFARGHDVYLRTGFEDVNNADRASPLAVLVSQGQGTASCDPAGLFAFGQTYYWRVDEVNAPPDSTVYKGDTWRFTVEPYGYPVKPVKATASSSMASTMGPEKTIDGSGLDASDQHGVSASQMWLSKKGVTPIWIQYEFDGVYKMHQMWVWNSNQAVEQTVGFGAKDVVIETSTDGAAWTSLADVPEFAQGTGEPNYVHNTTVDFGGVLARYVKLTIKSNWADGNKQAGLGEVRFFYAPVRAFGPTPADGGTGVALDAVLNWRPGRDAVRHEVVVGSEASAVAKGTVPVRKVADHQLGLGPLGLEYGRTYYWKVNEVNDAATPQVWEGDVWTFATIGYAVVDDFESYTDACNRIFFAWVDGFGYSGAPGCGMAASAGNSTGSTVGNVNPPFAERTIVHGGRASMPMSYDNTRSPFYSEAQREWPTAQSWTGGGVNTLVVYLRGDAPGCVEVSPGNILMNGTGTDIWDATDQFRFAFKSLRGNGSIVAKVESIAVTHEWAKAGVMIRESPASGSPHAFLAATPTASHGLSFQRRINPDTADNLATDVADTPLPQWIKVTRNGTSFTAQYSADGKAWMDVVPTAPVTITMSNDVLIGLAVTSHSAGTACGVRFSNVSTTGTVSGQWQVAEIGAAQSNGNAPEAFYVAAQDGDGKVKAVTNPDPSVIATGDWMQWSIPLSQFTSGGVNLASVKKMIMGVGDRNSPKAGGAGKLYVDDIRLTRVETP